MLGLELPCLRTKPPKTSLGNPAQPITRGDSGRNIVGPPCVLVYPFWVPLEEAVGINIHGEADIAPGLGDLLGPQP